ncbi:TolB family protein [bacterium]|nr:TolB family protein [bacterium]
MKNADSYGLFETACDIGSVKHAGSSIYDSDTDHYRLKGSGSNMWLGRDEFYFLYRKIGGNFILDTQVSWIGEGVHEHRKAGLCIRENLEPGSRHVSAEFHGGDGLISMQYRKEPDSMTLEQSSQDRFLSVLRLEKTGRNVQMWAAKPGQVLQKIGKIEMPFDSTAFCMGLFVCSHDSNTVEETVFINTRLTIPAKPDFIPYQDYIGSRLEILDIGSRQRKIIFQSDTPFEAPNWSRDGLFMVVNSQGKLYHIPAEGGDRILIDTDFARNNNNDHGFSPDGSQLAISHHAADRPAGKNSVIYTLPVSGGVPGQVTEKSPSYWHSWSPDGSTLIYTANRNDQWDLYAIPSEGGEEIQLTDNPALDDGSDFTPDGKHIWFNSNRTGSMEIWRMKADGSEQTQITDDSYQNWFPHPSPDGKWVIFLSYPPEVDAWDHPYYQKVMLRLIRLQDMKIEVAAYLYGGQGTINVPSWSPDSRRVAFVSYSSDLAKVSF